MVVIIYYIRGKNILENKSEGIHDTSFASKSPFKFFYHESKNLNGLGWNRNASYFSFNLDGTWMEIDQSEDRIINL